MKRVKIISDGTAYGTRIDAVEGEPIPGVEKATITIQSGEINKADLVVSFVDVSSEAQARFVVCFNGELREVKRIEFVDGTSWDA